MSWFEYSVQCNVEATYREMNETWRWHLCCWVLRQNIAAVRICCCQVMWTEARAVNCGLVVSTVTCQLTAKLCTLTRCVNLVPTQQQEPFSQNEYTSMLYWAGGVYNGINIQITFLLGIFSWAELSDVCVSFPFFSFSIFSVHCLIPGCTSLSPTRLPQLKSQ